MARRGLRGERWRGGGLRWRRWLGRGLLAAGAVLRACLGVCLAAACVLCCACCAVAVCLTRAASLACSSAAGPRSLDENQIGGKYGTGFSSASGGKGALRTAWKAKHGARHKVDTEKCRFTLK